MDISNFQSKINELLYPSTLDEVSIHNQAMFIDKQDIDKAVKEFEYFKTTPKLLDKSTHGKYDLELHFSTNRIYVFASLNGEFKGVLKAEVAQIVHGFPVEKHSFVLDQGSGIGYALYKLLISYYRGLVSDISLTWQGGKGSLGIWIKLSKEYNLRSYIVTKEGKLREIGYINEKYISKTDDGRRFVVSEIDLLKGSVNALLFL